MKPRMSTSTKSSSGSDPPADSPALAATPHTCALCGKTIKGGQRFLTLSVDEKSEPRRSTPSSNGKKSNGPGKRARDPIGSRNIYGHSRMPTSVTCHLRCLRCVECGFPVSGPPRGASNDERSLLFDRGGAAAAYKESIELSNGKAACDNAMSVGITSRERRRERWVADVLKNFVAHAKCAERLCAICGKVISPGEQQITLPKNSTRGRGYRNDVGGPYLQMNSRSNSSHSEALQSTLSNSKCDKKNLLYQHMRCTCCTTCGIPLSEQKSCNESRENLKSFRPQDRHEGILLDDSGRPHHASCMACCCCRQPLFGGYEVHSFFGYSKMCQQALGESSPLPPLPEGRAAALFGSAKIQDKTQLQKSSRYIGSIQSNPRNQLQEFVTPKFGGLCCMWCQGRVPCCVSCERRCTVYTDANGQQFLPRALTSSAQRAAELAAAISLGHVVRSAELTGSGKDGASRMSAASSRSVRSRGGSDALHKLLSSGIGGRKNVTGNRVTDGDTLTAKASISSAHSNHTLKTAESQGVLCGQCASLSLVETEAHLKNCADWILQFFGEEGVIFTPEMIHLQRLMQNVSKDNAEGKKEGTFRRTCSTVTQPASSSSAASSVNRAQRQSGGRMDCERVRNFAGGKLRSKGLATKEPRPLQQIVAAGLLVDLVSFDALNNGLPQRNSSIHSSSTRRCECLPAARASQSYCRRLALRGPCDGLSVSVPDRGSFPNKEQLDEPASRNASGLTGSGRQIRAWKESQYVRAVSRLTTDSKFSHSTARRRLYLTLEKDTANLRYHAIDLVTGHWKGSEQSRLLFGRCHVIEVSLVVAADAAYQFDKQLKAAQQRNRHTRAEIPGSRHMKFVDGGVAGTSKARGNMALKRLETPVNQETFERAAACAASVEVEEDQLSRLRSGDKREGGDTEADVAITAGALLMKGSFAGGLVKTASGLHAQGLCVRLVKRLLVVGVLPRVVVLQHLAHELVHAFFACKQKVINDVPTEEGACNVAAAAVLLRAGASLKALLEDSQAFSKSDNMSSCKAGSLSSQHSNNFDLSFELLLVRYRLWKMAESTDAVYGVGYRRCLEMVKTAHLTFGAFVSRLLETPCT